LIYDEPLRRKHHRTRQSKAKHAEIMSTLSAEHCTLRTAPTAIRGWR
jgi:hypothetical protein